MEKNKVIEFLSFLSVFFLLILLFNAPIRVVYSTLSLKNYSMYLWINGALGIVLYICNKIINPKFNKFEIIIFIMILLSCLSLISAIDINTAIIGKAGRYEGLLVWLTYYVFMLNAMNIKNKKYLYVIIGMISIYVLGNIFYGLYQVGVFGTPKSFKVVNIRDAASGFLGNPMCLGSLTSIFYGIILGSFMKVKVGIKKYLLGVLVLIANLGVLMCSSMSVIVGIMVVNLLFLIEAIVRLIKKQENRFNYLISFVFSIISLFLVFMVYTDEHPKVKNDILQLFGEAGDAIDSGEINDNYGTGRIYIWRNTIEKMKESPITGFGIDNFNKAFKSQLFDSKSHGMVDKAHNDYLQKALCEGIPAGILFVTFLLIIFFKGIFRNLSPLYYGLLMAFTCYSVTAFFNISVIRVAPVYFVVIGLLLGKVSEKKIKNEKLDSAE